MTLSAQLISRQYLVCLQKIAKADQSICLKNIQHQKGKYE